MEKKVEGIREGKVRGRSRWDWRRSGERGWSMDLKYKESKTGSFLDYRVGKWIMGGSEKLEY